MDETQIMDDIQDVLSTSPATKANEAKHKITYDRVPMSQAIETLDNEGAKVYGTGSADGDVPVIDSVSRPTNGDKVNTTREKPGAIPTIHINDGSRNAVTLADRGGDTYIGGSVTPNSVVNATLRPMHQYGKDPFWLESTERFTPVQPWTAKLAILNEPVKSDTFDPDKFAYRVARSYLKVPEENFFGYEYLEPAKESWWSSFWSDLGRASADISANTYSAIVGKFSDEERAKTPEQRAQENRDAKPSWKNLGLGKLRSDAQHYLDYVNQLEPIERSRGSEIAGAVGSFVPSAIPEAVSWFTGSGPLAWIVGAAGTSILSATETLGTRDQALANGMSLSEAQAAEWKHMGFIGGTEIIGSVAGQKITNKMIDAAIRRGATRRAAQIMGAATGFATEGAGGGTLEVYQDKVGNIVSGQANINSLYAPWTRDEWTTLYASMLTFGAASAAAGSHRGGQTFDKTSEMFNEYMAMVAREKKALVDKATERGAKVPDSLLKAIDDLAIRIWENPQAEIDENMRPVAQGFFDTLNDLNPEVVARAKKLLENPETAQQYSEAAFQELDNRVRQQPWFNTLSKEEQSIILGLVRGAAYAGALFFNTPPSEIKIPSFAKTKSMLSFGVMGHFVPSIVITSEISKTDDSIKGQRESLRTYLETEDEADAVFQEIENKVMANELTVDDAEAFAEELLKKYKLKEHKIIGEAAGAIDVAKDFPLLFKSTVSNLVDMLTYKSSLVDSQASGAGAVATLPEDRMPTDDGSPFSQYVRNPKYVSGRTQLGRLLETILHEFTHANDWGIRGKTVEDFGKFAKWYIRSISAVFGKGNAKMVGEELDNNYGFKPLPYTSHKNATEWHAQAVGRLMRRAEDYIGLTGMPAQFIQLVNAMLSSLNEETPIGGGVTEFVSALREFVNANSKTIDKFRKSVPAEKMRAAIAAYMGGEENIDWYGITPSTLAEFAKAIDGKYLNSEALNYAVKALGDVEMKDFVTKAQQDWGSTWNKLEKKDPTLSRGTEERKKKVKETSQIEEGLTETEKTEEERETKIDGGLNPEVEEQIEDWDSPIQESRSRSPRDIGEELARMAEEAKKKNPSEFQKAVTRKFDGQTVRESMEDFDKTLDEHKNVKFGRWAAFLRGPEAILTALGGSKLANIFSFITRYEDYTNRFLAFNDNMVKRLLPLFNGSRAKYENYIRETSVPMYKIDYTLPSGVVEQRLVSKRELMSALLYDEQPDSHDRIAKTVDVEAAKKLLDPLDVKFAHELRQMLYDDYRKVKEGKNQEKVPENYWPIMDSYAQERGDTQIVNDFGRKKTEEPIGLVDVMSVIGGYLSRRAGAESGYFAAARRLNTVINYDKRKNTFARMDDEDLEENDALDKLSSDIQRKIKNRIGTDNYERLRDAVADIIGHKNDNDLKDSLAAKISRNVVSGLLIGKLKQVPINAAGLFGWLGYEHNSYLTFVPNVIMAIIDSIGSWKLAMENESLRNRRALYRYNEVMHKNLSANSDNILTYVADWATKHNIYGVDAIADLLIHVGQMFKKTMAFSVRESDAYMNAIGYAASYKAAVKALGSEEAAKISLAHYLNTTQSTSNQATKSTAVRKFNRQGWWGSVFAFTSEPTQRYGSMTEAMNQFLAGEMSFDQMSRVLVGNSLAMAAYVAVQAGFFIAMIMPFLGGDLSDDDWDRIYDYAAKESVAALSGVAGPYSNIAIQPFAEQLFFDYNVLGGNNIPMLAEFARTTTDIKKGNYEKAGLALLSFFGILNGANNAGSFVRGARDYANANNRRETNAALLQMFGYSEAKANNMAGVKKERNKK